MSLITSLTLALFLTTRANLDLRAIREEIIQDDAFLRKHRNDPDEVLFRASMDFDNQVFRHYSNSSDPILIFILPLIESRFGNFFGWYFEILSCARVTGAHFIAVFIGESKLRPILEKLPQVIFNEAIESFKVVKSRISHHCSLNNDPWRTSKGAWLQNFPMISQLLTPILLEEFQSNHQFQAFVDMMNLMVPFSSYFETTTKWKSINSLMGTSINNNSSTTSISSVPFIGNVSIHIRCGDVFALECSKTKMTFYGFNHFSVYKALIPQDSQYIHILTQPCHENINICEGCEILITSLVLFLSSQFPKAVTSVIYPEVSESLIHLRFTPLVICSSSTFCFFGAISNPNIVYFPSTTLLLGKRRYYFRDTWRWIIYPSIICLKNYSSSPNRFTPEIIKTLTSTQPNVTFCFSGKLGNCYKVML